MPIRLLALALVGALFQVEIPVPDFDTEKVKASYVLSKPTDYDAKKKYPLIVDFHGAIHPTQIGANVTAGRLWSKFADKADCFVLGLNGRTRAWGMVEGDKDDAAFARHALKIVREEYGIDPGRIYAAGFSSGSDWLCKSDFPLDEAIRAVLIVCPGPPNVVGLRGGELVKKKNVPYLFATGEVDYIRKAGAWEGHLAMKEAGGRTLYREVPEKAHEFFGLDEYVRLFRALELLARGKKVKDEVFLQPSQKVAKKWIAEAEAIDVEKSLGHAFEAWWRILTRFHGDAKIRARAQKELDALREKNDNRTLLRARKEYFKNRRL